MKRYITLALLTVVATLSLALPSQVAAAPFNFFKDTCVKSSSTAPNPADSAACKDAAANQTGADNGIYGKNGILAKTASIIAVIAGIAAVIVIIVSGIQMILATGESAKIATARNSIIYAVIGLVIVLVAQSIVRLVISRL